MDDVLRELLSRNLNLKDTEELIYIWEEHNTEEYRKEAFEIIREILLDRIGYLPPQSNRQKVKQILNDIDSLFDAGNLEKAVKECDTLIQLEPSLAEAYHYRGMIFDEMGKLEDAIADYQKAVQLNPDFEDAWEDLFSVEEEIESEFLESTTKQYLDNAQAYALEGEVVKAIEEIEKATSSMPNIASAYNYLGIIFEEMDRIESAIEAYRVAIQLNPRHYFSWNNLSNASYKLDEYQYRQISRIRVDSIPEFDELEQTNSTNEKEPIPGWVYLDYSSYLLKGWPGHRTRPGRSGYDPLDSDFEYAQMQGRIMRMLFTKKLRTHNPFYLLFMTLVGMIFCLPIILSVGATLNGEFEYFAFMFHYGIQSAIGIAIMFNVLSSIQIRKTDEFEDNGSPFF